MKRHYPGLLAPPLETKLPGYIVHLDVFLFPVESLYTQQLPLQVIVESSANCQP